MTNSYRCGLFLCFFLSPALAVADALCVSVDVAVDMPREQAWEVLSDFGLAHNYVPDLTSTEIVSSQRQGVGAHRRVYQADGGYVEETVTEWREGRGFTIRLHEGEEPLTPFESAEFSYQLAALEGIRTRVTLSLTAVMPWGGVGETLGRWFIAPVMENQLVQIAAGLKYFYETGQPATDSDREQLAPVVDLAGSGCH